MCLALHPVWIDVWDVPFFMHSHYGWQVFKSGLDFFFQEADKIWTLSDKCFKIADKERILQISLFKGSRTKFEFWILVSFGGQGVLDKKWNVPMTMLNYLCIACTVPSSVFLYNRPKFQSRKYCCKLGKKWEFGVWSHRCWRNRQYLIWSSDKNYNWPGIFYFIFGWQPSRRD